MRRATPAEVAGRRYDVVVIGGGITGAATAREAALRGLTVLLVEKDDFAAGTSSRSSKLIHGGLRYLESYQFRLVAESLRERERMLRVAPHLTEVRPFLYLLHDGEPPSRFLLSLGLTFYDVASGAWRTRRHRMLSAAQVAAREPYLATEGLRGAGLFHDVLTDDARLTVDTVHGAAEAGAHVLNHAAVTGLVLEDGRAGGVRVADRIGGGTFEVRARRVLNATGPWTERTRALETPDGDGSRPEAGPVTRPTKGVHIVVRRSDFPLGTAVFLRSPDDGRVVWPVPSLQEDLVYIGTTDTDYTGDLDDVHPEPADIRYLLDVANRAIPAARLTERHVVGSWAGLRPLVAPPPGVSESDTSREHQISTGPAGMLTISGGKLTSSRLMARQLVDAAVSSMRRRTRRAPVRPLPGADARAIRDVRTTALAHAVPLPIVETWIGRYGSKARHVLERWLAGPDAREVVGVRLLTRAEIAYCVEEELVVTLADLMVRRTSAFFWDATGGLASIEAVADELQRLVPWTDRQRRAEVEEYRALVARHRPAP